MTTSTRKNTIIPSAALAAFLLMTPIAAQGIAGGGWLAGQDTAASETARSATAQDDDWPWETAGDDWPWENLSS